ncbi:MAG: hypothetical protein K2O86_04735 [Clostridia bacterium]|nr:hypothetical protein [Clostridia bacterium]
MQTKTKSQKAILLAVVATILVIATLLMFTACKDPANEPDNGSGNAEYYAKSYDARLNGVVSNMGVDFTEDLFEGAYVKEKDGKYEITLIFGVGEINMGGTGYSVKLTSFVNSAPSVDYRGETVTPVFGYYNDKTLVTDGIVLTYSSGNNYVTNKNGSFYYVQSMTFTVDTLQEEYILFLFVMAGNETMASSMQFPYALNGGGVANAVLQLDLTSEGEEKNIGNLLGIDTLNEVQA